LNRKKDIGRATAAYTAVLFGFIRTRTNTTG
jgi:hypothetical protein